MDTLYLNLTSPTPASLSLPSSSTASLNPNLISLVSLLLTRSPDSRISFQALFDYSYLDLAFVPSSRSMIKAEECLAQAQEAISSSSQIISAAVTGLLFPKNKDNVISISSSINRRQLYLDGVAHFLAHLQWIGGREIVYKPLQASDADQVAGGTVRKEMADTQKRIETVLEIVEKIKQ